MSSLPTTVALFYVISFILSVCSFTFAAPEEITGVTYVAKNNSCYHYIMSALLLLADMDAVDGGQKKNRVKRQGGFQDAASMSGMKVFRSFCSYFQNIFAVEPVGGRHPMSRSVPKHIVKLIKLSIVERLFPSPKGQ